MDKTDSVCEGKNIAGRENMNMSIFREHQVDLYVKGR